ncbi:ABC transporter substrate-binding protein [Frankia sp. CNm7]|uniref:ABC transporter substrate-binding protein n=1 Tax=Frankia nepalensis TaxID=1836974 RepID=A0A937USN9_9ACTN|nr:ABC transporter substrate-binding protein [Frankia nepalensis]MBL7495073.1 ABC transporter substrate-binding protein [Frankia nepalensis]MBL7515325.1 ABC transporter substrate-binding protein [Frankia nepalensis]MBL7522312.1 ABC transporter substrate-binding protein [Frankia nepalensis]MBL7632308.1 ABC transporter substrate-binding protein [Frankia nepalensis]
MKLQRLLVVGAAACLVAAGCSSGRDDAAVVGAPGATASGSASAACDSADLQATDIGITKDTITIETVADVGSQAAPGIANGSLEAMKAWADVVNKSGGLACREVVIRTFDSKLDPGESRSGMVDSCQNAFADVGSFTLAVADVTPLAECVDGAGKPTGQPQVPAVSTNALIACNKTTYLAQGITFSCPPSQGARTFTVGTSLGDYLRQVVGGDAHGQFQIGYTSPSFLDVTMPTVVQLRAQGLAGPVYGAKAADPQSAYTSVVQGMKSSGAQFVFANSTFPSFVQLQREAAAQGVEVPHWFCQGACYDPAYVKAAGDLAKGTEILLASLPFEEADVNEEMKTFVDNVDTHNTFAFSSWVAARLFQQAVEAVVTKDGPNGLTRASVLGALEAVKDFDAGGLIGPNTPSAHLPNLCVVAVKVGADGGFERVFPKEAGTLSCAGSGKQTFDPIAEFSR